MEKAPFRILVVDDDLDNRVILKRRLQPLGFHVIEADSGTSALAVIATEAVDLVLLDINMPDMDGVAVLKTIRSTTPATKLPVIMVTGSTQIADVMRARTSGANDYVMKPIDFPVALARVRAQLSGKRPASSPAG
jgi:DNA-binding response OmpR family regulator